MMQFEKPNSRLLGGWAAAFAAVLVGAGWQLATRHGARTALAPLDLALLRYTVPALLLLPLWWRCGLLPAGVSKRRLACMVLGAGLPFGLLAITGAHYAPAAHMGALMPGLAPVFTLLGAWCVAGERASRMRLLGVAFTLVGVLCVVRPSVAGMSAEVLLGDALFVCAALVWTAYTLAFRGAGIGPWQAAALINAWSAVAVLPLWWFSSGARLASAARADIALQLFAQGVLAGVLGLVVIGHAIKTVGASTTMAVGALVPTVVAVGAAWLLQEPLGALTLAGAALTTLGVVLVSATK
jgi:drug/metabolite transporter (DMT)-like permease